MDTQPARAGTVFLKLKAICVPLLGKSRLNNGTIPEILSLLDQLIICLQDIEDDSDVNLHLPRYVYQPLSAILHRNEYLPDQVMEKILDVIALLFRWWWYTCEDVRWEQFYRLASSTLGSTAENSGHNKRSEETKESAARLLLALTRDRSEDEHVVAKGPAFVSSAKLRLNDLKIIARKPEFIPIVGQTLNTLLLTACSEHLPLQLYSLQAIELSISIYLPESILPTIFPGVVSTMTRIALGYKDSKGKGWANGPIVSASLNIIACTVILVIGDEVCTSLGLVQELTGLDDLAELISEPAAVSVDSNPDTGRNWNKVIRSKSWLRGTASQLFIAINSLSPLMYHPTASALLALSHLSGSLLSNTRLTVPQLQPLLLSFLLTLSNAKFDSVCNHSRDTLVKLLSTANKGHHDLLQAIIHHASENLLVLPHLLPAHADSKVIHAASQITAICNLGSSSTSALESSIPAISHMVGKLLGPTGQVEKWGWSLLSVLELSPPDIVDAPRVNLMLESSLESADQIVFPEVILRQSSSRDTLDALEAMLRALGRAGGKDGLFAIEWFVGIGRQGTETSSAVAFWCACRILEGVAGIDLGNSQERGGHKLRQEGKRVEKFARWLAKTLSEVWDKDSDDLEGESKPENTDLTEEETTSNPVEYRKGLIPLDMKVGLNKKVTPSRSHRQPILHKSFALQLLCVCAESLGPRFNNLLIYTLYPILHSLISSSPHLSSTAMAALQRITYSTGYASPANLLLSNFDYALDSVSRRLTRRWLDADAAKVLVVLVRLVGKDVVDLAGDVVEECFDRLDDYHGYSVIVEGIVEALQEVMKALDPLDLSEDDDQYAEPPDESIPDSKRLKALLDWMAHRHDPPPTDEEEDSEPATQETASEGMGKGKGKAPTYEDEDQDGENNNEKDNTQTESKPSPTQSLVAQIVSRSIYLLTHGSASIRARILSLLATAAPFLQRTALLPQVHRAWPFILNRLSDQETYVVSAAASLIEALSIRTGSFMSTRVWDEAWPKFREMLRKLDVSDSASALARRGKGLVGTESAYTHSHRLYRAMLRTMSAAVKSNVRIQDSRAWEVLLAFRRFLHKGKNNSDAVWLVLTSTASTPGVPHLSHMQQSIWDLQENVDIIIHTIDDGIT